MCIGAIFGKPKMPKPLPPPKAPQRDDDAIKRREEEALMEAQTSRGRLSTFISGLVPSSAIQTQRRVLGGA